VEEEEEEDNGFVDDVTRVIEIEIDEGDYEVDYDLEEDEELMMFEEEHTRFIPATKSCIEELKMVKVEDVTKCTICLEDVNIGVALPCSHIFHTNCIRDWLVIGHCCPLCRFQLPTSNMMSE
ncbi:zinc finger protein, partial [Trifolium pratense]